MQSTIYGIYCMQYLYNVHTYVCIVYIFINARLVAHSEEISRTMTKETFHVLLVHLTFNTQHPFFFLSKYKVHIVYALLTHMLSKLKWRKIITQTEMPLRRVYTVDSFSCTFYFYLFFTSFFSKRHINVTCILKILLL